MKDFDILTDPAETWEIHAITVQRRRADRLRWWVIALATTLVCSVISTTIHAYRMGWEIAECRAEHRERR